MNSHNKQFINKKRNMHREDEDETTENILEKNKNVKDQIEQLSQKQNLMFVELQKERAEKQQYILGLEQNIHSMKKIIQSQNKIQEENLKKMELNINLLKSEREKDIKSIDNLRKYIGELEYK